MKRNKELIRRILIALEEKADDELAPLDHPLLEEYSESDITYNALLLGTSGFITYQFLKGIDVILVGRPTLQGYKLLEQIRDDTIFNAIKKTGISFSFQVLTKVAPTLLMGGL